MSRVALQDYTFSDGTRIPRGTLVMAASRPIHHDAELYAPDADAFDPWRFANMRQEEGETTKHQMVNTSNEYVSFGHGKHAWCVFSLPLCLLLARADGAACKARDASSR